MIGRIPALSKGAAQNDSLEINKAIGEVIELTHGEAERIGVSVRTDLVDGLPLVRGDRVRLQQVILNLVLNAFEAMSCVRGGTRVA